MASRKSTPQEVPAIYHETPQGLRRGLVTVNSLRDLDVPAFGDGSGDISQAVMLRAYNIAVGILTAFFGKDWSDEHVRPVRNGMQDFLRRNIADFESWNTHLVRVVMLAEMIFNLQHKAGLDAVLSQIRGGQIESGSAELEVGKWLEINNVAFRFVEPQQKRGFDYDVELFHFNGMLCCGDAKCKIESTSYSLNTVLSTLRDGQKQLPSDRPGILFVKVPQDWIAASSFKDEMQELAKQFFRGTKRVVSLEFFGETLDFSGGFLTGGITGFALQNDSHRFDPGRLDWKLTSRYTLEHQRPRSWVRLVDVVPRLEPHWKRVTINGQAAR